MPAFFYVSRFPLPDYSLGQLLVIIEIIGITILGIIYNQNIKEYHKVLGLIMLALLITHTVISALYIEYALSYQIIIKTIRFIIYIYSTFIFAQLFYDVELFRKVFTVFFYFSLIPFFFYLVDNSLFSIKEYYSSRFCGLFSEPSALGPFLTVFVLSAFLNRRYIFLLFLAIVWLKTDSGSAYVILFVTSITIYGRFSLSILRKMPLMLILGLVIVLSWTNLSHLKISALKKITDMFVYTDLSNGVAGQSRIQTLLNSINIMVEDRALFIGYGTNTWETITNRKQELRIFNLVHMLFISYGYWSLGIIGLIFVRAKNIIVSLSNFEKLLFISFLTSAFINSAQGALLWKLGLLFLFIPHRKLY